MMNEYEYEDELRFIFTYGETFLVKEYCQNEWPTLLQKAEEGKMILVTDSNEGIQESVNIIGREPMRERLRWHITSRGSTWTVTIALIRWR